MGHQSTRLRSRAGGRWARSRVSPILPSPAPPPPRRRARPLSGAWLPSQHDGGKPLRRGTRPSPWPSGLDAVTVPAPALLGRVDGNGAPDGDSLEVPRPPLPLLGASHPGVLVARGVAARGSSSRVLSGAPPTAASLCAASRLLSRSWRSRRHLRSELSPAGGSGVRPSPAPIRVTPSRRGAPRARPRRRAAPPPRRCCGASCGTRAALPPSPGWARRP